MRRVMVDLETLALDPRAAIVSIGAVQFDENGPMGDKTFYGVARDPRQAPQLLMATMHPRVVSKGTLEWWEAQGDEARAVFSDPNAVSVDALLGQFYDWLPKGIEDELWAGPAHFDIPILETAFRESAIYVPWSHRKVRCLSTLSSLCREFGIRDAGDATRREVHHNALDDARFQATHAAAMLRNLKEKLQ